MMDARDIVNFYVVNRINPEADTLAEGQYSALVAWRSPAVNRPNRQSRRIRVELGRAYVDDFNELAERQQDIVGDRLAGEIVAELARGGYDEFSEEQEPFVVGPIRPAAP